ncbi:MAG: acetyltransferase [Bacteroidota bacterium]
MKRLAIIGSGDLGQLIAHHAKHSHEVVGFFDDFAQPGEIVAGHPVLGALDLIDAKFDEGLFDELIIAIGYKHFDFRASLFERLSTKYDFATLIHPSCSVDPTAQIGKGSCLLPGSVLDRQVRIGPNVLVNVGCTIAHDSSVGAHSFLSPSVSVAGFVDIGTHCNIGIGSVLIDNITIASHVQTGGGTVVIGSLERKGLYVGNPSRFVK